MIDLYLDFETYYDNIYSLRRLTTAEYILSPYFECYMASWALGDSPIQVTTGVDNVRKVMRAMPWDKLRVVAHNIHFDSAILAWHFRCPPPLRWACSMAAMRIAHPEWPKHALKACAEKLGLPAKGDVLSRMSAVRWGRAPPALRDEMAFYGRRDVELLRAIWGHRPRCLDGAEGRYLDLTVRLWTEPKLLLDVTALLKLKVQAEQDVQNLVDRTMPLGVSAQLLRSDVQLARYCETILGIAVPMKTSPVTGKLIPAMSKRDSVMVDWLDGLAGPVCQVVAEAKFGVRSTLERTRVQRLLAIATATKGVIPVPLVFGNTNTWRLAGGEKLNLQNLPRTAKDKKTPHPLRRSIFAPLGHVIVRVDAAQIECRILAWWAGETWLNKAFAEGRDPYCEFGESMFGRPVAKTDWERHPSKVAVLSCGYNASHRAFEIMLINEGVKLPPGSMMNLAALALKAVNHYRRMNKNIVDLWSQGQQALEVIRGTEGTQKIPLRVYIGQNLKVLYMPGRVLLPSGHEILYPGVGVESLGSGPQFYWTRRGLKNKIYGSKLVENAVQAMARDHVMEVWDRIATKYPWIQVGLQVHDDLACVVRQDRADEAARIVKSEMSMAPAWAPKLVLGASVGIASRLGDAKD